MIATKDLQLTVDAAQEIADAYISKVFDKTYFTYNGEASDGAYHFTVACTREDMTRNVAVGSVSVFVSGDIQTLSQDRIRDMKEAGEVQAAQKRKEFARGENGYVLRYHARIKASSWLAKHVDHKIGADGGVFVPIDSPIWRFLVYDFALESEDNPLGVIDVDALTGAIIKPNDEELEIIVRGACATRKHPQYSAAV